MHKLTSKLYEQWNENNSNWLERLNWLIINYHKDLQRELQERAGSWHQDILKNVLGLDKVCDKCGK